MSLREEAFRALLDARGLLRPNAQLDMPAATTLIAFSQTKGIVLPVGRFQAAAERFFDCKLGLSVDKRYEGSLPDIDAARVVVSSPSAQGTRVIMVRPSVPGDLERAEQAEISQGVSGMFALAKRCPRVLLIESEGADDRVALLLAALVASVELGPIVTPKAEIFGVRTARMKLEALTSPYR
jgi:hypothetical protein